MKSRKLWEEVAKSCGCTPRQARREVQALIEEAYRNPPTTEAMLLQNSVPRRGAIPTPEEFILYCSMQVHAELQRDGAE